MPLLFTYDIRHIFSWPSSFVCPIDADGTVSDPDKVWVYTVCPDLTVLIFRIIIWVTAWQTNKMTCAPSKDSYMPGHQPSLIRVFAVRMKKHWAFKYLLSAQWRLWSDWANTRANQSLWWAHMSFCWFYRAAARMVLLMVLQWWVRLQKLASEKKIFECFFFFLQKFSLSVAMATNHNQWFGQNSYSL